MDRKTTLGKAFQRGHLLNLKSKFYEDWIEKFVVDETRGDIGTGDITSETLISQDNIAEAIVESRHDGIVAGIEEATFLYSGYKISVTKLVKDGEHVKAGQHILRIKGKERDILSVERSALDILQRMSGIATLTGELIRKIDGKVALSCTRKTQWRYLDKKAVFIGGGLTHRLALWDSILVKDNHLFAMKKSGIKDAIEASIERSWTKRSKSVFIEIEVSSAEDAILAASIFKRLKQKDNDYPMLIMLDNMDPAYIKKTIDKLKQLGLFEYVLIEASGGINPENIQEYASTGIDVISMGYLTHSSHALDIKQRII